VSDARTRNSVAPGSGARRQRVWSRFLLIALLLHVPLYIYPVLRLCAWLGVDGWLALVILLPVVCSQVVSRLYLRGRKSWWAVAYREFADCWLGLAPLILLPLLVFEVIVYTTSLAPHVAAVWVIALAAVAGVYGMINAAIPRVKRLAFAVAKLRAPVRIVQITDVHIGSRSGRFLARVLDRVNRLQPDFLCITGDFIDATGVGEDVLAPLTGVVCPIYFCIGNHEKYEDLDQILVRLGNLGVVLLRNRAVHHRSDIQVIGIDDMDDPAQVERQLIPIDLDHSAMSVLLYHRPRGLEAAAQAGIDLMLSGHTHNGQIFPFNLVVRRVFERIAGLYQHEGTRLYVSEGTGTWGPAMRVGTRSEITLFEVSPTAGG
jgi:uncharacterized protein